MTSRPAAPEQDGPSSGPAAGDERRPARAGSVAPQPRAVPAEPAEAPAAVEPTTGAPAERTGTGTALPARMIRADGGTAYADTGFGRHLRWLLGLLLVLACGAGIARWTGATRLRDRRRRHWAVGVSLTGPLLITLGFLAAAW